MNRRHFIQSVGAFSLMAAAPSFTRLPGLIGQAEAAQLTNANYVLPQRLPQVINLFLYGGAHSDQLEKYIKYVEASVV